MLGAEQELPVEIAEIDCIQVYNVDFAEASENEVFEKLAADTAGSYHENAGLWSVSMLAHGCDAIGAVCTCLIRAWREPKLWRAYLSRDIAMQWWCCIGLRHGKGGIRWGWRKLECAVK